MNLTFIKVRHDLIEQKHKSTKRSKIAEGQEQFGRFLHHRKLGPNRLYTKIIETYTQLNFDADF